MKNWRYYDIVLWALGLFVVWLFWLGESADYTERSEREAAKRAAIECVITMPDGSTQTWPKRGAPTDSPYDTDCYETKIHAWTMWRRDHADR